MQTLRRERRNKFEKILSRFTDRFTQAEIETLAELLADASESKSERKTYESKGAYSTAYLRGEQEQPDKVSEWLKMAQFPGAKKQARIDAILSYLGEAFHIQTERKDWKNFAEYILVMQDKNGWSVEQFVRWLKSKPDFNIDYWTAARMKERYQQAFVAQTEQPSGKGFFA